MQQFSFRYTINSLWGRLALSLLPSAALFPVTAHAQHRTATKAHIVPAAHVILRDPQHTADALNNAMAQKLHLEPGADVLPTAFLDSEEAQGDRDLQILRAMQQAEGGYDAVNIYDRGILSWGIMQWSAHENSLQECLWFIKERLMQRGKGNVWAALFKEQGLDVQIADGEPAFFVGGPVAWKPVTGIEDLRILFRGTRTVGGYDQPTVVHWAQIFARAGRQPLLQRYQNLWATRRLRGALNEHIAEGLTVREITGGDLFSDALYFSFWTNNPAAARRHLNIALAQARLVTGESDPAKWPTTLFPFLWEQVGLTTNFGTWPARTRIVERAIGAGKFNRESAFRQLASRGWAMSTLRSGQRTASARLWTREPIIRKPDTEPNLSRLSASATVELPTGANPWTMLAIPNTSLAAIAPLHSYPSGITAFAKTVQESPYGKKKNSRNRNWFDKDGTGSSGMGESKWFKKAK